MLDFVQRPVPACCTSAVAEESLSTPRRVWLCRFFPSLFDWLLRDAAEEEPRPDRAGPRKSARLLGLDSPRNADQGPSTAYNKDLQGRPEKVFDVADTLYGLLSVCPPDHLRLKFPIDRMKRRLRRAIDAMAAAYVSLHKGRFRFGRRTRFSVNAVPLGLETERELNCTDAGGTADFEPEFGEGDFLFRIALEATLDCHDVRRNCAGRVLCLVKMRGGRIDALSAG